MHALISHFITLFTLAITAPPDIFYLEKKGVDAPTYLSTTHEPPQLSLPLSIAKIAYLVSPLIPLAIESISTYCFPLNTKILIPSREILLVLTTKFITPIAAKNANSLEANLPLRTIDVTLLSLFVPLSYHLI